MGVIGVCISEFISPSLQEVVSHCHSEAPAEESLHLNMLLSLDFPVSQRNISGLWGMEQNDSETRRRTG